MGQRRVSPKPHCGAHAGPTGTRAGTTSRLQVCGLEQSRHLLNWETHNRSLGWEAFVESFTKDPRWQL